MPEIYVGPSFDGTAEIKLNTKRNIDKSRIYSNLDNLGITNESLEEFCGQVIGVADCNGDVVESVCLFHDVIYRSSNNKITPPAP